jgi:hypothetical protein
VSTRRCVGILVIASAALIAGGERARTDRPAAIQTDMSALGRFLVTKKEPDRAFGPKPPRPQPPGS